MLQQFFSLLSDKEKKTAVFVVGLLLCLTAAEFISLGLIMPFLSLIMNPNLVEENEHLKYVYQVINPDSIHEFEIQLGFFLIIVYILKTSFAYFADKKRIHAAKQVEYNIMCRLLRSNLANRYPFFLKHPPSSLYHKLVGEAPQLALFFNSSLVFFSECTIILAIIGLFMLVAIEAAMFLFIGFAAVVSLSFFLVRKQIARCSKEREFFGLKRGRNSLQNFNGIKDLKIFNNEFYFLKKFKEYNYKFLTSRAKLKLIEQLQYHLIGLISFVSIVSILIFMVYTGKASEEIIPVIAVFVAGSFRLMPSAIKLLNSATTMKHAERTVKLVHNMFWETDGSREELMKDLSHVDLFVDKKQRLPLHESFKIDIRSFIYESRGLEVFRNFSIEFQKNKTIGLVGASGSGKTTLIDILLGLNILKDGAIYVDGNRVEEDRMCNLRNNIGYVPQRVFLYDTSILNNIAFGYEGDEIDMERIDAVVKLAQLDSFIQTLPEGHQTVVGEFGVKVSGGQLQRIGIARALYLDPQIIILDEATSALDNKTEAEFMYSINQLKGNKTIIISAHRLSTIRNCDIIYFMDQGKIKASGNYEELLNNFSEFSNLVALQAASQKSKDAGDEI